MVSLATPAKKHIKCTVSCIIQQSHQLENADYPRDHNQITLCVSAVIIHSFVFRAVSYTRNYWWMVESRRTESNTGIIYIHSRLAKSALAWMVQVLTVQIKMLMYKFISWKLQIICRAIPAQSLISLMGMHGGCRHKPFHYGWDTIWPAQLDRKVHWSAGCCWSEPQKGHI